MADTTFVNFQTPILAEWLNDVNDLTYNISGTGPGQGASLVGTEDGSTVAKHLYGHVSVMQHGADPTGVTANFHTVVDAAVAALPSSGGIVEIPAGVYVAGAKITDSGKTVQFVGHGFSAISNTSGPTTVWKNAGVSGNGWELTGLGSAVKNLTFRGETGNSGDGLVLLGGRQVFEDIMITKMGNDGLRIGKDAGGGNMNLWQGRNLISKGNGRHGLMLSENIALPNAANCNGGSLFGADLQVNGGSGLYIENSQLNTFVGVTAQTNSVDGVHVSPTGRLNVIVGGDWEANGNKNLVTEAGSVQCWVVNMTTAFADTAIAGANYVTLSNYQSFPFGVTSTFATGTTDYPFKAENAGNTSNGRGVGLLLRPPGGGGTSRDGLQIASEQETTNKDYTRFNVNISGVMTEMLRISPVQLAVMPGTTTDTYSLGSPTVKWKTLNATNVTLSPGASVTPANNGEVMFQLTSNTSLTFKVKGSDGTVRSGSITLA